MGHVYSVRCVYHILRPNGYRDPIVFQAGMGIPNFHGLGIGHDARRLGFCRADLNASRAYLHCQRPHHQCSLSGWHHWHRNM